MKGIILAGGTGSRLHPLTKVTNKHLLPIYNKPMIYYPIETLRKAGIKEALIVSGKGHAGHFLELLGSGKNVGMDLFYDVQEEAGGIAQALKLAKGFAGDDDVAVILGDNIYTEEFDFTDFRGGARIYLKKVPDANRFGVASLDGSRVLMITEKPEVPMTNYAVTGLYLYDKNVFSICESLVPSKRGELEITDVNNTFIEQGKMQADFVKGFWSDAGTFDSLHRTCAYMYELANK
ncbi:NTP transferase domain-containing protein [Candidatus Woesearchaeota archaeon]|nr:NTP transferase domain-containing protein [Candidatus Woesearchaeota archaeon]